jgi:hypothetical protein
MAIDWTEQLLAQLTWLWDQQLRPGLEGLTDEELLWEGAPADSPRNRASLGR